jgi:drug/metabolite transporter (DMT)-like permease
MPSSSSPTASRASIVVAFACLYFFWGSTYTAIRVGAQYMPALLMGGVRYIASGLLMLVWCRSRGLRLWWPWRAMLIQAVVGFFLLTLSNGALIYAEKSVPSGLASLILASMPLMVALAEMLLPGGEPLPLRGWLGLGLGMTGLGALVWPSLRTGFGGDSARVVAIGILLFGAACWTAGSLIPRRARLPMHAFVASAWQMLLGGLISMIAGSCLGQWPQFHVNVASVSSVAYLVVFGSLVGYTSFVYLLEHVPVAKVSSYAYVNPVVAVVLGILLLGERPEPAEFAGMVLILLSVFLVTTSRIQAHPSNPAELERLPGE